MDQNLTESKSNNVSKYYQYVRHDVIELIPGNVCSVLEVGCGAGRTGQFVREKFNAYVAGIELDPDAAKEARVVLDDLVQGDIETMDVPYPEGSFDCILFADVLEHLKDPLAVIRKYKNLLTAGGSMVASIPNVQFYEVVHQLIEGNWTYQDEGILDRTHLRFYTFKEIEKLFREAGLEIESITENLVPQAKGLEGGNKDSLQIGRLQISGLSEEEIRRFFVYQYKVVAKKKVERKDLNAAKNSYSGRRQNNAEASASSSPRRNGNVVENRLEKAVYGNKEPLVSVVIPVYNGERFIADSLESVLQQSHRNLEILLCDDFSRDRTEEVVRRYKDSRIRWCESEKNLGHVKNLNRGIRLAEGEFVCWLNQDDLFLENKIEVQLKAFQENPELGAVFCRKFDVNGNLQKVNRFNPSQFEFNSQSQALINFFAHGCTVCAPTAMFHRKIFETVGFFDEQYKIAFDFDMWFRILKVCPIANIGTPLLKYRHHDLNTSGRPENTFQILDESKQIIRDAIRKLEVKDLDPEFAEEMKSSEVSEDRLVMENQFWEFYAQFFSINGVWSFRQTLADSFREKVQNGNPEPCLESR
ncbi:glycosyltransferase [Nitrospina watsonii]|uniref:Enzyme n=1 Tax=Nitrospina watsonii TaxID=1323948 RepID=A0ABN8W3G8_9BACT|nr:glycosyltransferase [Nitrospina watsonii]CAI2718633.1 putative enzyme [Nitrospina watsonii]